MSENHAPNGDRPGETVVIDRSNAQDRWKYTCPEGHTAMCVNAAGIIQCKTCGNNGNGYMVNAIVNQKTGERVPVDRVEFIPGGWP